MDLRTVLSTPYSCSVCGEPVWVVDREGELEYIRICEHRTAVINLKLEVVLHAQGTMDTE